MVFHLSTFFYFFKFRSFIELRFLTLNTLLCFVWCFVSFYFLILRETIFDFSFISLVGMTNINRDFKLELKGTNLFLLESKMKRSLDIEAQPQQYASLRSSLSDLILLSAVYLLSFSCFSSSWQFNSEVKPAGLPTTLTVVSFLQRDGDLICIFWVLKPNDSQWSDS